MAWKKTMQLPKDQDNRLLELSREIVRERTDAIVGSNTDLYPACAAYIAALGEVLESREEAGARQRILREYRDAHHRAWQFVGPLQKFGLTSAPAP
jgi:hypothetical protein